MWRKEFLCGTRDFTHETTRSQNKAYQTYILRYFGSLQKLQLANYNRCEMCSTAVIHGKALV